MNWIDYTIFTTLFFAALFGLASGPVIQLLRIIGIFISFFTAIIFYEALGRVLQGTFSTLTAYLVSYFIIFFVAIAIVYIIIDVLRRLLGEMAGGMGLRLLGGILGILKGLVFCGVIILGILSFSSSTVQMVTKTSKTASQIGKGMQTIAAIVPRDILDKMKGGNEETKKTKPTKGRKSKKSADKKDKEPVKADTASDEENEIIEEYIVPPQERR